MEKPIIALVVNGERGPPRLFVWNDQYLAGRPGTKECNLSLRAFQSTCFFYATVKNGNERVLLFL
jgi:hypothetical protein